MAKKIIVVGDSTDHGGKVISGSPKDTIMGKSIARMGDLVDCPQRYPNKKPHGVNKIIEGDPTYLIEGIPVALEGHKTECGCSLIGSVASTQESGGGSTGTALTEEHYEAAGLAMPTKTSEHTAEEKENHGK